VYLDFNNPKAELALDLLLGTQGWRRFAFFDPMKFTNKAQTSDWDIEKVERVLGIHKAEISEEKTTEPATISSTSSSLASKIKKMGKKSKKEEKESKSEEKPASPRRDKDDKKRRKIRRKTSHP